MVLLSSPVVSNLLLCHLNCSLYCNNSVQQFRCL
jgi:hypothetical protein